MTPPEFSAANESTSTPKRSSRCFMPATAPLNANTNVPHRASSRTILLMYCDGCLIKSDCSVSAVYEVISASDERCFIGEKKTNQRGYFFRLAEAAERMT